MNPTDKQGLKSELSGIQGVLGAVDKLIKTASGQGNTPPAAVATICNALQNLNQATQKTLKFLEKVIDKS